jgi:hypothetical protein
MMSNRIFYTGTRKVRVNADTDADADANTTITEPRQNRLSR